ncbi:FAD-binding oxidoreductase [bacterium]|nr:FAD-binding oxidoreductase [bacterium]
MKVIHLNSKTALKEHILKGEQTLYVGSKTSTVIPWDDYSLTKEKVIVDLSSMPCKMEMDDNHNLTIEGAVTWKEAKAFCQSRGRKVMTSPTEELALCLSGVATSCTGERCFGHGTLRDQIIELEYINHLGEEGLLSSTKKIDCQFSSLSQYQADYKTYQGFKNAPFPRLENEIDLMVGTEGQLGVVTKAVFKTVSASNEIYLFIKLPKWEINYEAHLEVYEKVQKLRDLVESVELIDENSISYLPQEERPCAGHDLIFLELSSLNLEKVYEELISKFKNISEDQVFEMSASACREFRMNVPRYIFEQNQKMGVTKMGTDVQAQKDKFKDLLDIYRSWTELGLEYNLFGHFGDAHLHFNFMPKKEQVDECQRILSDFYHEVKKMHASPFAEHGIGIIKQKFIKNFYNEKHIATFNFLKEKYDPTNKFFPSGYMSNL